MLEKFLYWILYMGIAATIGICFVPSVKATFATQADPVVLAEMFLCFTDADCPSDQPQCVFETANAEVGQCELARCQPEQHMECAITECWYSLGEDGTLQCHEPNSCEESPEKWEVCTGMCTLYFDN